MDCTEMGPQMSATTLSPWALYSVLLSFGNGLRGAFAFKLTQVSQKSGWKDVSKLMPVAIRFSTICRKSSRFTRRWSSLIEICLTVMFAAWGTLASVMRYRPRISGIVPSPITFEVGLRMKQFLPSINREKPARATQDTGSVNAIWGA